MSLPLAAVPFYMTLVMILWLLTCVALVFIILIQKGKGGGLSAAFGGAGGTGSLFGTKTGDFLTWVTIGMAGFFLFLSVIMGLYYKPVSSVQDQQNQMAPGASQTAPSTQTTPEAPASSQPAAPAAPAAPASAPAPAPQPTNGTSSTPAQ
jgi:preprotein translocase subunit SecG